MVGCMATKLANETALDAALERLRSTDMFYGQGLVNHGPMATEALENMDRSHAIDRFLEAYVHQLSPAGADSPVLAAPGNDWPAFVARRASSLAPSAGALAGHGLLRMAHAVRALERVDTPTRRQDLAAAVRYWEAGNGLTVPRGQGDVGLVDTVAALPRLAGEQQPGLISDTLERVADDPRVGPVLAARAPFASPERRLDELALASVDRYLANGDRRAFTFIHGVTVSTLASVLLGYLDDGAKRVLVEAVESFVLLAIVGYDRAPDALAAIDEVAIASPADLATAASLTDNDHTIKFVDACIVLAERTGSRAPLAAATVRCAATG